MAYHATPTLSYGGQPPPYPHVVTNVVTVAHDLIMGGRSAHVPTRDTAEQVMKLLGMDPDTIRFRMHHAETGGILHSVDPQPVR